MEYSARRHVRSPGKNRARDRGRIGNRRGDREALRPARRGRGGRRSRYRRPPTRIGGGDHPGGRPRPRLTPATCRSPPSVDALFRAVAAATSAPRHPRQQRRHRRTSARSSRPRPRISTASTASTWSASTSARAPRCPSCCGQGGGVILNMASIAVARRAARSLRLLDDQGRRADDDALDRRRLREARHPLQLHLPGARPHAVRRRLPRRRTIRAARPR